MKTLLFMYAMSCGADAISTHAALAAGGREAMLTQSSAVNTSVIAAETVGSIVAMKRLNETHPRLARVMVIGGMAFRSYVAVHNFQVARGQR